MVGVDSGDGDSLFIYLFVEKKADYNPHASFYVYHEAFRIIYI